MNVSHNLIELISETDISKKVKRIAYEMSICYKNESVILIVVLNGAIFFAADLVRELDIDCKLDFVKVSSYNGTKSNGKINFEKKLSLDIERKNIVIIEDIIDTGNTINYLRNYVAMKNPKSLRIATLLMKPDMSDLAFNIDWVGFDISSEFVVGYGLDYNQEFRNLNAIYKLGEVI